MGATDDDGESTVDDDWDSPPPDVREVVQASIADHDRTTIGTGADRILPRVDNGAAAVNSPTTAGPDRADPLPDHDRTTIGTGADRIEPRDDLAEPAGVVTAEDSALEQAMAELDGSDTSADDELKSDLGVGSDSSSGFAVLRAGGSKISLAKERELVQPEHSPLSFVMGETTKKQSSNDSSRFVISLVGGQSSVPVEEDAPVITAMQPVLRRARLRRTWIVASALAATVVAGTAVVTLGSSDKALAKQNATVTEPASAPNVAATPAPTNVAAAPAPSNVAAAPAPSNVANESEGQPELAPLPEAEAEAEVVAMATTETSAKPHAKPATTKTKPTSKRPATTAKKPVTKKSVAKSTAKKAPTKTTAKKPTAKKATTAKKPAKKSSTKKSSR